MENAVSSRWSVIALCALLAALGSATPTTAQTVIGQARAVRFVSPTGATTVLADTGTLGSSEDARQVAVPVGSIQSLVSGNTLHATTIRWSDQVESEASLAGLAVTVNGIAIGADFVMARASALLGFAATRSASIEGLSINGLPITVTGLPNQTVPIPGGQVVINEQPTSMTTIVNALHIAVAGVADIVVASATARVQ